MALRHGNPVEPEEHSQYHCFCCGSDNDTIYSEIRCRIPGVDQTIHLCWLCLELSYEHLKDKLAKMKEQVR